MSSNLSSTTDDFEISFYVILSGYKLQISQLHLMVPLKKQPMHACACTHTYQTTSYTKALNFGGALSLWPTGLGYNMADNPH
jgi:hypothetical protein